MVLNDTPAKIAEIVRRFRLYSNQPDEMITFRSLARMKPGRLDLDPRLYQYGGCWIYPIGGLLKLGSMIGLITLKTDLAFYLDHPEQFAQFYLVARGYSAIWGLLGVPVVYALGREWTGSFFVGAASAAVYAAMPVVIDLAHEAKPHLAGTVLTLTSIWAAMRYVRTGQSRWWLLAGITAGAAMGMVLTGYVAFAVLPGMALLRPMSWAARFRVALLAGLSGAGIFVLSNPYLPYNYLLHREVLRSNVGNYGTFYRPEISISAIIAAVRFLIQGMSPLPMVVGVIGVMTFVVFTLRSRMVDRTRYGLLLAAPATLLLIQFVLLADAKADEYARFAVTLDVLLGLTAAAMVNRLAVKPGEKISLAVLLVVATLFFGSRYDINFIADNRPDSTRRTTAETLERLKNRNETLALWAEPAPYCMPPVDLFAWRIVLLPRGADASWLHRGFVGVRAVDESPHQTVSSPISWANKSFAIIRSSGS
jgi:hypothetical protein